MHFSQITAEPIDLPALRRAYERLKSQVNDDPEGAIVAWDDLRRTVGTTSSLTRLRFTQNTADAERKRAFESLEETLPSIKALDTDVQVELLKSAQRPRLEREFGDQAFALWQTDTETFAPQIEADLVTESKTASEYTELTGGARVTFRGEELTLSGLAKYFESADRQTRHDAEATRWGFFSEHREEFEGIYDRLVRLRDEIARKLGYATFTDLGYKRMQRVDYGPEDVSRWRDEIVREVVPFVNELVERQRVRLGVDRVRYWDEPVLDPRGNPAPQGDRAWIVGRARKAFAALDPRIGDFFTRMADGEFLDLDNRPGKAMGGYCTSFPTYGMPFIFTNFNGTAHDVTVLVHETGHAFQAYSSAKARLYDYLWPTLESAEIDSMSLEFLAWPQMEQFFGDDADRFRATHLEQALRFLPYGAAVDHFQHLVYANPSASPAERNAMWKEMEARYLPWRDFGDIAYAAEGTAWQRQLHIYQVPFYYIDYTLAQCCALQFWSASRRDPHDALERYVALCGRGGELAFGGLVKLAGLTSPFESGVLSNVVAEARTVLS